MIDSTVPHSSLNEKNPPQSHVPVLLNDVNIIKNNSKDHSNYFSAQDEEAKTFNTMTIQANPNHFYTNIDVSQPQSSAIIISPSSFSPSYTSPQDSNSESSGPSSLTVDNTNITILQRSIIRPLLAYLFTIQDIETKLIILRMLTLCIFIGVMSLLGILSSADEIPYNAFIVTIYGYLAFFILENSVRMHCEQRASSDIYEDLPSIIDSGSALIFLLCVQHPSDLSLAIVTFMSALLPLMYHSLTKRSQLLKISGVVFRLFATTQILLIMLQLTRYISWNWTLVLAEMWLILIGLAIPMIVICLLVLFSRFYIFILCFLHRERYHSNYLKQCCLAVWLLSYNMLGCLVAVYIYGISLALQDVNSSTLLRLSSTIGLVLCSTPLITAGFMLDIFLSYYFLLNISQIAEDFSNNINTQDLFPTRAAKVPQVSLKMVKHNQYFIRISGCYFVPLTANAALKYTTKVYKIDGLNRTQQPHNVEETLNDDISKTIPKPARVSSVQTGIQATKDATKETTSNIHISQAVDIHIRRTKSLGCKSSTTASTQTQNKTMDEELCYICCVNPQNAVMMRCGHSGVCYTCAERYLKNELRCMECRATVDMIAVIERETYLKGVYRSSQYMKVMRHQKVHQIL